MRAQHYVAGFMFDKERQQVALIEKKKPEWQRDKLNGIGGKIEPVDESPRHAMAREFREETGVAADDWRHFCTLYSGGEEGWSVYFFAAFGDLSKLSTQEEERIIIAEIKHLSLLPLIPNLHWLIPMALDRTIVSARILDAA